MPFALARCQLQRDPALSTTPCDRTEVHLLDHRLRTDVGVGKRGQDPGRTAQPSGRTLRERDSWLLPKFVVSGVGALDAQSGGV